jgi:hypothetical protein
LVKLPTPFGNFAKTAHDDGMPPRYAQCSPLTALDGASTAPANLQAPE